MKNDDPIFRRRALERLVAERLETNWPAFESAHPHLARAIRRVTLAESIADRIGDSPEFERALAAAAADRTMLEAAAEVSELLDGAVRRMLGL